MTATPMTTVVPFPKPKKRGRPSKADDLQIEIDSRRFEERRMALEAAPLLRRLEIGAIELGPSWLATVQHLAYLHDRHARRWSHTPDEGNAA